MDNKKELGIGMLILMGVGAVIGGIGGAATVSELPDNWEKLTSKFNKKSGSSDEQSE